MNLAPLEPRLNPGQLPGPMVQDLGTVPAFASYPQANHTIYLDFNGHVTEGTTWNGSKYGMAIYTPPYNTDGSASFFSVGEQIAIREMFNSVAEDFVPFAVNVTTIAPPESDLIRSDLADTRWGVRVAIGGAHSDWYGAFNSGVALTTCFSWLETNDTTVFVFPDTLSNHTQWIAETISHEAGHSLGLSHDMSVGNPYYLGHGTGPTGWAPIMGGSFYKPVTQWDNGTFAGALNKQDDLAIITSQNGFGYRPDDYVTPHGMMIGQAASGVIERNTDTDIFAIEAVWNDKPVTKLVSTRITVSPADFIANLDVKAKLYDWAGTLLWDSSPIDALNIDFTITLRVGQMYYLHVSGDGSVNYSNYGSLGQYTVGVNRA